MIDNIDATADDLAFIRSLPDFDLIMLLSEINEHGWEEARKLLPLIAAYHVAKAGGRAMNIPAVIPADTLPALIDRATAALECARTSAEVLEARDMARVAYDAAKSAGRIHRAKQAHDSLIAEVHRAQAHALAIRARAEMRLAEEYDAAQERGEVATVGQRANVVGSNVSTAADLGLRRDEIHDWRKLRDAEAAEPGLVARALDDMLERNGHILWMEWKRGVILDAFETQFKAQIRQARAFTENSPKQTFIFVIGCPVEMDVNAYRVMWRGRFGPWEHGGTDALRSRLKRWFAYADEQRGAA